MYFRDVDSLLKELKRLVETPPREDWCGSQFCAWTEDGYWHGFSPCNDCPLLSYLDEKEGDKE